MIPGATGGAARHEATGDTGRHNTPKSCLVRGTSCLVGGTRLFLFIMCAVAAAPVVCFVQGTRVVLQSEVYLDRLSLLLVGVQEVTRGTVRKYFSEEAMSGGI